MWAYSSIIMLALDVLTSSWWHPRREVPWVPTSMSTVRKMLEMAAVRPGDVVYDLGCGDGRLVITAALRHGARGVGIEIDPIRWLWCQVLITVLFLRHRVRIVRGSFHDQDLSEANVVTCYLLQRTNEQLEGKLREELRPGTRVVSHDYTFPGLHLLRQDDEAQLYLYELRP
jgi:hypothetical protein